MLTGRVGGADSRRGGEARALTRVGRRLRVPLSRTIAVGDGANDLLMMACAGLSVAFDAKAAVRAQADVIVDARDLSQILALVGLRG